MHPSLVLRRARTAELPVVALGTTTQPCASASSSTPSMSLSRCRCLATQLMLAQPTPDGPLDALSHWARAAQPTAEARTRTHSVAVMAGPVRVIRSGLSRAFDSVEGAGVTFRPGQLWSVCDHAVISEPWRGPDFRMRPPVPTRQVVGIHPDSRSSRPLHKGCWVTGERTRPNLPPLKNGTSEGR